VEGKLVKGKTEIRRIDDQSELGVQGILDGILAILNRCELLISRLRAHSRRMNLLEEGIEKLDCYLYVENLRERWENGLGERTHPQLRALAPVFGLSVPRLATFPNCLG